MHISYGNMKLGRIANWSLPPGVACSDIAKTTCFVSGCYARKAYRMYPETRAAWHDNYDVCLNNLPTFETGMNMFLDSYKGEFFRVHTAGDFFSSDYTSSWDKITRSHPNIKFLAFTKQFDIVRPFDFADNFTVILSAWPCVEVPKDLIDKYHVAWMQDGTEDRIPADALHCPGDCTTCGACWGLNRDTYFTKH